MMELVTGLDIGNGYVKGKFCGVGGTAVNVDIPSCVAGIVSPPSLPDNVSPEYIGDIFNRMICQIQSPLVRDTRYFNFGTGAIATGRSLLQFDIADSSSSKAIQPLSSILMLGIAAGEALRNYYDENKCLPAEILRAEVQAAVALPIDEYMTYRDVFSNQFMNVEHEVTICNFEVPVHVRLTFSGVHVMPEGVSAQYAITSKGEAFIQALLDDVRDHDPNALPGITARDVLSCENTCGIDIGEGTVNFPVIKDGKFNAIASSTLKQGYGTVLEQAVPRVLKANMPYDTRKVLADFFTAAGIGVQPSEKEYRMGYCEIGVCRSCERYYFHGIQDSSRRRCRSDLCIWRRCYSDEGSAVSGTD